VGAAERHQVIGGQRFVYVFPGGGEVAGSDTEFFDGFLDHGWGEVSVLVPQVLEPEFGRAAPVSKERRGCLGIELDVLQRMAYGRLTDSLKQCRDTGLLENRGAVLLAGHVLSTRAAELGRRSIA